MGFWGLPVAQYVVQSVLHGIVALVLTEASIQAWRVKDPFVRFRYRLATLILPAMMQPAFQLATPTRGDFYFRLRVALFDSRRWLELRSFDDVPLTGWLFALLLLIAALVTLLQELRPALAREGTTPATPGAPIPPELSLLVEELAQKMGVLRPTLGLVDLEVPIIVNAGVREPAIYLSRALLTALTPRELRAAVCHELAHVRRRSNRTTLLVFFLRVWLFFNPVALLVFRRLVQDDEQICDDIARHTLGDGHALAKALEKLLAAQLGDVDTTTTVRARIEEGGFRLLLRERTERLRQPAAPGQVGHAWEGWLTCVGAILVLSYFIV